MISRKAGCFYQGTLSEKRFAEFLARKCIDHTVEVGTDADLKGKVDFIVKGQKVNVKAPTRTGPQGLCVEWRAVNGSSGWLHQVDYVVKFIDDSTYIRISCSELKAYVVEKLGEPPVKCPQTGASRSDGSWYARANWQGKDRSKEACAIVPFDNIKHISKEIKL